MDDDVRLAMLLLSMPLLVAGMMVLFITTDSETGGRIALYVFIGLFVLLSLVLLSGHGSWLVAGYNTASPEEKAQCDPKKVARGTGIITMGCVFLFASILAKGVYFYIGLGLFTLSLVIGIVYCTRFAKASPIITEKQ